MQKLINVLYRHPVSAIKRYQKFGGYFQYRKMLRGKRQMMAAAHRIAPIQSYPGGLPLYFLTGKNYLYQTLFCICSLTKVTSTKFNFILVDDGSFDDAIISQINKQLPGATVVTNTEIEQNLQHHLPESKYPNLRNKRKVYPHLKKLTDIHTISGKGWKLVLDSDMLFWQQPTALLQWLNQPNRPLHMLDCVESYGYSQPLMAQLSQTGIPALLNVGAIGLNSADINWADMDHWIKALEEKEGASYYLEQALSAMIIGDTESMILSRENYIVNPAGLGNADAVLHHYVDLSKKIYFGQAWQKLIG